MKISGDPEDVLVTYSLGSCIGVSLYDPAAQVGGLIHCMLPLSKLDPARAREKPCMFTDTGLPELMRAMIAKGAEKKRIVAKVAGASRLSDDNNTFRIGDRNKVVLRKVLWKNNILIAAEDTGGNVARTMYLNIDTGETTIRSAGKTYVLE
jgi:chemotaxis protein CheD